MTRLARRRLFEPAFMPVLVSAVILALSVGGTPADGAGEDLTVPFITPKTGSGANFATQWLNGANMAAEEINAAGGVAQRKLRFSVEDDGSDPNRGASTAKRIGPDSVVVLLDTISTVAVATVPALNQQGVVALLPGTSRIQVVQENRPWSFSTFPELKSTFVDSIALWKQREQIKRVAIATDAADAGTQNQRQWIAEALTKAGLSVADEATFVTTDVDFTAVASRLKRANADGVIVVALPQQAGAVIAEARKQGIKSSIWVSRASWDPNVLRKVVGPQGLEGVYTSEIFSVTDTRPKVAAFVNAYKKKYTTIPDGIAALSYESVYLLKDAVEKLRLTLSPAKRTAEREALRDYLAKLDWNGPFGNVKMGSDGVVKRDSLTLRMDASGNALPSQ